MTRPRRGRRYGVVLLTALVALLALAGPAAAHPLGNFTTNTAVRMVLAPDGADVRYVLDLAEIPTTRFRQQVDVDGDDRVDEAERSRAADDRCRELLGSLTVAVDGERVPLDPNAGSLDFLDGQAGLPTTRLVCDARLDADLSGVELRLDDGTAVDRVGWREITAVGDRLRLETDVPTDSATALLRSYPSSALTAPQRTTSATIRTTAGGPPAPPDAIDGDVAVDAEDAGFFERLSLRYTDLVAERELTPLFGLVAVLLAMLLGTAHALAPGHGKTIMAAYVVGQRGTARQALAIGGTVAVTHTIGVLLLGIVLSTSEVVAPERIYPYLGVLSGGLVVAIGVGLVRRAWRRRGSSGHHHAHGHGHEHDHAHDHPHAHGDHGHTHVLPDPDLGWRGLVTLGVAGGLSPSPSALLVLLGAIALDRTWFGVLLVTAYGVGLAGLLVVGGLVLVRVRGAAEGLLDLASRPRLAVVTRNLPFITGVAVVGGGMLIAARAVWLT